MTSHVDTAQPRAPPRSLRRDPRFSPAAAGNTHGIPAANTRVATPRRSRIVRGAPQTPLVTSWAIARSSSVPDTGRRGAHAAPDAQPPLSAASAASPTTAALPAIPRPHPALPRTRLPRGSRAGAAPCARAAAPPPPSGLCPPPRGPPSRSRKAAARGSARASPRRRACAVRLRGSRGPGIGQRRRLAAG